jgi:putative phosphoribosyl transferase
MIREISALRDQESVFDDREDAGRQLSSLLPPLVQKAPLLMAIPAGGVPVGAAIAESLGWPLNVAAVSKITLPWNTEAGYGAVAFDGSICLNESLLPALGLSPEEIDQGIARTRKKVERRDRLFRCGRPFPDLADRSVVLVDDGLASGFTLRAAIVALRRLGADFLVVAVPTGYASAVEKMAQEVTAVCCANIRGGRTFAVAAAYRHWRDVGEEEALERMSQVMSRC